MARWLEDEGVIRMGKGDLESAALREVVLTPKGFELLGKPVPGTEKSVGSQLQDLAKEAGQGAVTEASKSAIGEVIGAIMGSFVKSMTS
jgi:hypothetical protein